MLTKRSHLVVLGTIGAALTWYVAIAPPLAGFAVAVALAIAWSIWLDAHPEAVPAEPHVQPAGLASDHARAARRTPGRSATVTLGAIAIATLSASVGNAQTTAQGTDDEQVPASAPQSNRSAWRNVKFGGTLEGYYEYNWNRPPDRSLTLHAYDTRANTF